MEKVYIVHWLPNTGFMVRAGVFSNIDMVINHIEKSLFKSKFSTEYLAIIKQVFENDYLFKDDFISIECCWVE